MQLLNSVKIYQSFPTRPTSLYNIGHDNSSLPCTAVLNHYIEDVLLVKNNIASSQCYNRVRGHVIRYKTSLIQSIYGSIKKKLVLCKMLYLMGLLFDQAHFHYISLQAIIVNCGFMWLSAPVLAI